ncbi:MAG: hypothetical protein A3J38_07320 [Gammaproteobacteria bacterium RIFCSPHIGHO2_12_FULL_45_9]|nr:MAG: hypothetical protein A3J38_07320 [Gammaproteobacteria bacterium RIFCSPHIGHO2_12_FULL_45_9]
MRKHILLTTTLLLSGIASGSAYADGQPNLPPFTQPPAMTAPAAQPANNAKNDVNTETFAHIESLDKDIEETGKEVQAMKAHQELQSLMLTKEKRGPGFTILRIEGFNGKLYAVFMMPNQSIERATVGDYVDELYKVTKITPHSVSVQDVKHHESFSTPFFASPETQK